MLTNRSTENTWTTAARNPFIGTRPFSRTDAAFFFGRDREATELANMVFASTITILYGDSGVGKSSLLNARLPDALEDIEPDWVSVPFFEWQPGFELRFDQSIRERLGQAADEKYLLDEGSLAKKLLSFSSQHDRPILLILDQFEEYFLYNPAGHEGFESEIAKLVNRRRGLVHVLISLRSDGLFLLDRLRLRIPDIFGRMMILEPLGIDAAIDCVIKPIAAYNEQFNGNVEIPGRKSDLVTALVLGSTEHEIRGRLEKAGIGEVDQKTTSSRIVALFLQMALDQLWEKDIVLQRANKLSLASLRDIAGLVSGDPANQAIGQIAQKFVDSILTAFSDDEKRVCASVFERMIMPSGQKVAVTMTDLRAFLPQSKHQLVERVFHELAAGTSERLIKTVASTSGDTAPQYQIVHDALATPILYWVDTWRKSQEAAEAANTLAEAKNRAVADALRARRKATRKITLVAIVAGLLLLAWPTYFVISVTQEVKRIADVIKNDKRSGFRESLLVSLAAMKSADGVFWWPIDKSELKGVLTDRLRRSPKFGGTFAAAAFDPEHARFAWYEKNGNKILICNLRAARSATTCVGDNGGLEQSIGGPPNIARDQTNDMSRLSQFPQYSLGFLKEYEEPAIYHSGILYTYADGKWSSLDVGTILKSIGADTLDGFIQIEFVDGVLRITINNWSAFKLWVRRLDVPRPISAATANALAASNDGTWKSVGWKGGSPPPNISPDAKKAAFLSLGDPVKNLSNILFRLADVNEPAKSKLFQAGSINAASSPSLSQLAAVGFTRDSGYSVAFTRDRATFVRADDIGKASSWSIDRAPHEAPCLGANFATAPLAISQVDERTHDARLACLTRFGATIFDKQSSGLLQLAGEPFLTDFASNRNPSQLTFDGEGQFLYLQSFDFNSKATDIRIWDIKRPQLSPDVDLSALVCRVADMVVRTREDEVGNQLSDRERREWGIKFQPCPKAPSN